MLPGGVRAPHAKLVREAGAAAPVPTGHFARKGEAENFVHLGSHENFRRFHSDDLNETCG